MTTPSPLDAAHAAMQAAPDDDAARLRFHARLADTELVVLLEREPEGETLAPRSITHAGHDFVLAFDSEARLAEFAGAAAPYAALPGRVLVQMLAQGGAGLALNLEVAPSAYLAPPEAMRWLAGTLEAAPEAGEGRIAALFPPRDLPEGLVEELDLRLARAAGLARAAYLAAAEYDGGGRGHVLAILGAEESAEAALARAMGEALTFSGVEAGALDVLFLPEDSPLLPRLQAVALHFELPQPQAPQPPRPAAPGRDPARPPKLR